MFLKNYTFLLLFKIRMMTFVFFKREICFYRRKDNEQFLNLISYFVSSARAIMQSIFAGIQNFALDSIFMKGNDILSWNPSRTETFDIKF